MFFASFDSSCTFQRTYWAAFSTSECVLWAAIAVGMHVTYARDARYFSASMADLAPLAAAMMA